MRKLPLIPFLILTLLGGIVAINVAPTAFHTVLADDDCDSSGPGNPCDDRDDDHDDDDDDHGGHGGDDQRDSAAQTALAQPVGEREIRIVDERYTPNTITIRAGETVTFVNADDDEHTATGPGFDTGKMLPGESVTITFDTPGSFDFVCQFHPEMRGTVIVEADDSPNASPQASPVASPVVLTPLATTAPDAAATEVTIDIADFSFSQPELTIQPGTTVTWVNTGVAPHTVSGLPTESGTLEPGQSFSFTFDSAGTFAYSCAFHPQMKGTVVVAS